LNIRPDFVNIKARPYSGHSLEIHDYHLLMKSDDDNVRV